MHFQQVSSCVVETKSVCLLSSILVLLCANNIQPLLYHVTYPLFNASIRITISAECIFVGIYLLLQGII